IEHNTLIGAGPGLWLDHGGKRSDKHRGTIIRDNLFVGRGGVRASDLGEGQPALEAFFTDDLVFRGHDIVGGASAKDARFSSSDPKAANFGFFWEKPPSKSQPGVGVRDWSSTGLGAAEAARDREPD